MKKTGILRRCGALRAASCAAWKRTLWIRFRLVSAAWCLAACLVLSFSAQVVTAATVSPAGSGSSVEEAVWGFLQSFIGNEYGTAGLMGNLWAESRLRSNNLENYYERTLGYTDESYTEAVDSGVYENFAEDGAGYGIAQWTFHTRKAGLLAYAREKGTSVGALRTQLEYLEKELTGDWYYKNYVLEVLRNATSVKEASDAVLEHFENPDDQSEEAKARRAEMGEGYYEQYASGSGAQELRKYAPVFDFSYYVNRYADVKAKHAESPEGALSHFLAIGMEEGRAGSSSFDPKIYRARYQELIRLYGNDMPRYYEHYLSTGLSEGRLGGIVQRSFENPVTVYRGVDYSLVYDYEDYMAKNPTVKVLFGYSDEVALEHFVRYGMAKGQCASDSFDPLLYRDRYPDLLRAYGGNLRAYYTHYMRYGYQEGRSGGAAAVIENPTTVYQGIDYSLVYDFQYYIDQNSDIKRVYGHDDLAALQHFVTYGMQEGRSAKASFDVRAYRDRYPDLLRAFGSDLKAYYIHYMQYGYDERRLASGGPVVIENPTTVYEGVDYSLVYDFKYYIDHNADIKRIYGHDDRAALLHFVTYGMDEGRSAKETFNARTYRSLHSDLDRAFGDDLRRYYTHYMTYGFNEGRLAH